MTQDNIVLVHGGTYPTVKDALQHWIDLYARDFAEDFSFELYKNGSNSFLIKPDTRLSAEHFYYLVNYMAYPVWVKYKREVKVKGHLTVPKESAFAGQKVLVYNSKTDTEPDNVSIVTEAGKHFRIDFGGKTTEIQDSKAFSTPKIHTLQNPEILKIRKVIQEEKDITDELASSKKRFNLLLGFSLLALVVHILLPFFSTDLDFFQDSILIICGLIGSWLLVDSELLRSDALYLKCLLLSIGLIGYGYFVCYHYQTEIPELSIAFFFLPITLLFMQWPLRRLFLRLFHYEPTFISHGMEEVNLPNFIYSLILLLSLIALPLVVFDWWCG